MVNSENLLRARDLKTLETLPQTQSGLVEMTTGVLEGGVAQGVIRPGIDPVQLNITIAAIGYYHLTNRFTGSILFGRDLMSKETIEARLDFNIETILRLVRA